MQLYGYILLSHPGHVTYSSDYGVYHSSDYYFLASSVFVVTYFEFTAPMGTYPHFSKHIMYGPQKTQI